MKAFCRASILLGWLIPTLEPSQSAVPQAMDSKGAGPQFEMSFPAAMHRQPITGRLFLLISQHGDREPRLQSMWFNSPEIVAIDVRNWAPEHSVIVDGRPLGTPLRSLSELAPGDYYVQAVVNRYTEFRRADGHTVWAHLDQGEGQQFNLSPGNLYSRVQKVHLDTSTRLRVSLSEVIPKIPTPQDTIWVKHVKVQSKLLTRFWGQPIFLGAVVLLPRDYASRANVSYPVIYYQPEHFRSFPPFEFETNPPQDAQAMQRRRERSGEESGYEFSQAWQSDGFPRFVAVSVQTPTPFSDWSGGIDSANNGPYGEAITTELMPVIEQQFRIIREGYARLLVGKHSGGRAALALQLHYPALFGGAWIFHPWPFNFERWSSANLYENDNLFRVRASDLASGLESILEWQPLERYVGRSGEGVPFITARQISQHDAVMASVASGDPVGADDAINGPVGEDGYPKRLWNRETGEIDHQVAEYWRQHGDLAYYTQEHWPSIGPALVGKLHFYVGDMDVFYRNYGVHLYEEQLKKTRNPHYEGSFYYGALKDSWQPMTNAELVQMMADHIVKAAPGNADRAWRE
jgi:hypothetical protein